MNIRGNRFEVDRTNGKLLGVCAGIANATGVDVTLVRVGVVIVTIMTHVWVGLLAYGVAFLIGNAGRGAGRTLAREEARDDVRERLRSHDLRMQAVETYTASANSKLAREIEELR
jgi:phage shock protein C